MAMANAGVVLRQAAEALVQGSLSDLVTRIRRNKGKDEAAFLSNAIQAIRKELRSTSKDVKAVAVQKLSYLQMLGYEMGSVAPDVVEVMSFPRFAHKRIGYLAAAQSFNSSTDILIMSTNLFRKDVTSSNQYEAGIALSALACVVTPDLARDLAPDIVTLLSHSRPYVRKKAILVLYNIFVAFPDALRPAFPKLKEKLKDEELPIVSAAVSVLCELARKNPSNYVKLAPTLFHLLTSGSAHAWLQLKLVKLFALLCPVEPRLPKRLVEPLTNIINTTPVMSLLYECINTCTTGLVKHLPIVRLCIQKLRMFIESTDQNHKYLGLLALGNIMTVHPKAVREHKDTVMRCLEDEDESIRLRALDLLVGMVDKKNLSEVVERLLEHLRTKAEGHYKAQLIGKIIAIAAQRDYKYITDFEWYLGVLVRLTHVPGNEQGKIISDQLMDVAVRVEVVRHYAVKEMVALLQDARFYGSQSKIVEVLFAAAFIAGEFSERKEAVAVVTALTDALVASVPGHIQSMFVSNSLKVFARLCGKTGVAGVDLMALSPEQQQQQKQADGLADEKLAAAMDKTLALLEQRLPVFAASEVVEVQERALFAQQVLRIYRSIGNATMAMELAHLFAQPLNPVHPDAQSMVPVPAGLDLNAQINQWPDETPEASWEEDDSAEQVPSGASEFGGYQHPSSFISGSSGSSLSAPSIAARGPAASAGPVDKRYYLSGNTSPSSGSGASAAVPDVQPLDLGTKVVVKDHRKKQGSKHAKAKVTTEFALPSGATGAGTTTVTGARKLTAGTLPARNDALGAVNLDEDLTTQEKDLLQHKTYPGATAAPKSLSAPSIAAAGGAATPSPPPAAVSPPGAADGEAGRRKKGAKRGTKKGAAPAASASAPTTPPPSAASSAPAVLADASAPQTMCTTDKLSALCRVVTDPANAKQINVQIAVQNRTTAPWINATFELKSVPNDVRLVSRSLPNPLAVAAGSAAPLLCVFSVASAVSAPVTVTASFTHDGAVAPILCSFSVLPSLFVAPAKIALEDLGRRIVTLGKELRTAAGVAVTGADQKTALKRISERLRVKKIRIESGAALFYGHTAHGADVFVHVKRASDTTMHVEIKCVDQQLAQSLVAQAMAP